MKRALLVILTISTVISAGAQEMDTLLTTANNMYKQGKYQDAATLYENILDQGYESPGIYYNLGNAYYKQNVIARAILNYERALQLSPNDEDIQYNLELANRFIVDKIEVLPVFFINAWFRNLKNIFSSNTWAVISLSGFVLFLILFSFYLYSRDAFFKKMSFWFGFLFVIISVTSLIFSHQQKQKVVSGNTAIVMNTSVTVKSSPDASGTDLFVLHEGTKVWIEDKIAEWKEIKLSDGSKGWIRSEDIETI